ncbi:hypothetical protein M407DRAFT_20221 [Tulasnella calospora MUT 4182]|uniref:F-box domain-containing protein n=1 Tax=Tulasnella calospora MUT 4182 TaxID=1051891 RepID=A0A0C3QQC7_9AGAM|nr:hypothetical protein M407DRAFT_20221 [Tulasnella calospora MUT 4182]
MVKLALLNFNEIFDTLPEDIYGEIFSHLTIREILELRTVCKAFVKATQLRQVWFQAIQRQILGENLTLTRQRKPLGDLETKELEYLARRTMKLAKNMAAHNPRPTSYTTVRDQIQGNNQQSGAEIYITQVLLMDGLAGSKWLLCMSAGYKISVWEILPDPVSCVPAGRWDNSSPMLDVKLNSVSDAEATLAITMQDKGQPGSYRAVIMKLSPLESGKIPAFTTVDVLPKPPGSLVYFQGDLVFFFRRRTGNITVINWRTKAEAIFHVQHGDEWPSYRAFEIHAGKIGFVTIDHIYVFDFPSDEATLFESPTPRLPLAVHSLSTAGASMKVEKATVVPYPPSWQLLLPSPDFGMSVILRRKVSSSAHEAFHYLVSWNTPTEKQAKDRDSEAAADIQIKCFRKAVIAPHYCADVKYAKSGRGVVLWQAKKGGKVQEGLSAFDPRRRHHLTGEVVWENDMPWRPFAGIDLPGNGLLNGCTAIDHDDGEGRIVVGTSEGKITILDFA